MDHPVFHDHVMVFCRKIARKLPLYLNVIGWIYALQSIRLPCYRDAADCFIVDKHARQPLQILDELYYSNLFWVNAGISSRESVVKIFNIYLAEGEIFSRFDY